MENSVIDFILKKDCGMFECIEFGEEYRKESEKEDVAYEELAKTLNEGQKQQLIKIMDLSMTKQCEALETYFKEGVKVGLRFAAECLID